MRVRSARSIEGLAFPPASSLADRRRVEQISVRALLGLAETHPQLAGSYCPLPGSGSVDELAAAGLATDSSVETLARLRRRGYIFGKPRSPVLCASGMDREWPDGRGVFSSADREVPFVAWLNEEDHLRLMCLANGSDVKAAFGVFATAVEALGEALQRLGGHAFARSERRGQPGIALPPHLSARSV